MWGEEWVDEDGESEGAAQEYEKNGEEREEDYAGFHGRRDGGDCDSSHEVEPVVQGC